MAHSQVLHNLQKEHMREGRRARKIATEQPSGAVLPGAQTTRPSSRMMCTEQPTIDQYKDSDPKLRCHPAGSQHTAADVSRKPPCREEVGKQRAVIWAATRWCADCQQMARRSNAQHAARKFVWRGCIGQWMLGGGADGWNKAKSPTAYA